MASPAQTSGSKRARTDEPTTDTPTKRRKVHVHHCIRHAQRIPKDIEPAPQDPIFSQGMLMKSITAALTIAGFDSVQPSALEMFRSHTEEYMLKLSSYINSSMSASRRTKPTPHDFAMALSLMPNASQASLLRPQLSLPIPENISYPSIPDPESAGPPAPDFSGLLQPLVDKDMPKYIPSHFPKLPPRHAWQQTPVYPDRETDARKMREKATQEGMMAEQALRKLAAAAKAGAFKAERRKSHALSGVGKVVASKEDAFADVLKDIGGLEESGIMDTTGGGGGEVDVGMPEGVVVNYDMGHWRRGSARRALQL